MGLLLVLTLAQIALPFAFPFVSGSGAGAGASTILSSSSSSSAVVPLQSHLRQTHVPPSARYMASIAASSDQAASASAEEDEVGKKSSSSERLTQPLLLPPPSNSTDHGDGGTLVERWRSGEVRASPISRLFFLYAVPLLRLASKRRLEASDSFELPESYRMEPSVESFSGIYRGLRANSQRRIEQLKQTDSEQLMKFESWLLIEAMLQHQRQELILTGALRLLNTAVQAFPALLVARLLRLVEAGEANHPSRALITAIALFSVLSLKMVTENQFFHHVVKFSTNVRGSLSGLIFDKSLKLPGGGSGVTYRERGVQQRALGMGGVLNLMQSDAGIIESAAMQLHTLWDAPLQIAIFTSLLFRYLGTSVFWGIAVLLVTIPVNSMALRLLNRLARFENEAKDARTRRTSESIRNMKLLKLQGWEHRFEEDIRASRKDELRRHVTRGVIRALNTAFSNAVPALVLVVTLTAYVKTGKPLVASTIFTAISLFNQLRYPLFFYPMLIDSLATGKTAVRRIASFLSSEEITPYVSRHPAINNGGSIELKNGNFLWSTLKASSPSSAVAPALFDVNVKINPGEIVALVGGVGSGKTALLKALLGELTPAPRTIVQQAVATSHESGHHPDEAQVEDDAQVLEKPSVILYSNVAYCSQEAWLPKGSIRDAVVFGREYNETRYKDALYDAGLDMDIASGVLSDDTDVGEGGASLSGGQRARTALARALYAGDDTKVFLLDDCLAALDASVGSTVFDRLVKRLRRSNSAALLVTNDPSIPRRCDRVILMEKLPMSSSCASILDVGTYNQLLSRGHDLRSSTHSAREAQKEHVDHDAIHDNDSLSVASNVAFTESPSLTNVLPKSIRVVGGYERHDNCTESTCHAEPECQIAMECSPDYIADHVVPVSPEPTDTDVMFWDAGNDTMTEIKNSVSKTTHSGILDAETEPEKKLSKMTSADDSMSTGAVPLSTYVSYFKSVRQPLLIMAMIGSYVVANGAQFFQQYTIAKWTEASHGAGNALAASLGAKYMSSLVNAAIVVSFFLWLRSFLTMKVGVRASEVLHSRMLSSVFAAPMSFFDATPSGQLLSRFGKEMETVDKGIPDSIGSVLFCFLQIFMSIGALVGIVTSAMLVPLAIVSIFYVRAMSLFRPGARDMKRAEIRTRSPIFTHFGEALRGTETIRSIPGATKTWSKSHRSLSDGNLCVYYSVKALDRWLSTRLETFGNIVVFTASVASVFLTRSGRLKAGAAGWALTQSLAITGLLTWAVRCLTDLETNMMSLQRVRELTDLESEEIDTSAAGWKAGTPPMPKELSRQGEALNLLPTSSNFNGTLVSLDSSSLREDGWPWRGNVGFFNVSMRYNPGSPLILNGVTLQVPSGTTLGVVGRTGSGKSSLLLTLFRLVEIETGGRIEIDGVDLRSVSLETLRQSLAIIPQDPVLFAGSVAFNLDATGKVSEDEMWNALEAASPSLAMQFRKSEGLSTHVSEGGKNLSLGQRQLICLARALLRKSRVLVMDEATSSVDSKTDQEVQETIKREFVDKGVTVITVAHRLDTVLGYDKIAVLGNGKVLEYGAPKELLRIPGGSLRRLLEADRRSKRMGAATPVLATFTQV